MAHEVGKRYECSECKAQVLCTKAGEGSVHCCGKQMEVQQPNVLPSSD